MNASAWTDRESFYRSFLEAVKAPEWHGLNFNALRDSIAGGDINGIEVPYRVVIQNFTSTPAHLRQIAGEFIDLIHDLEREGVPIQIRIEN